MAQVRTAFYTVIDKVPDLSNRVGPTAKIIANMNVENAVVKVIQGREEELTTADIESGIENCLLPVEVEDTEEDSGSGFLDYVL